MNSSGQPSNCYPPGVMYAPSPNNPVDMVQHHGAATGTAVMVDATGHHHYTSVLYSTPPDLTMEAVGMPSAAAAVCVGEGHSSSSSNSFVAPLSSSSSSSMFTPNYSTSVSSAAMKSSAATMGSSQSAAQNSSSTWAGRVKGKTPTNLASSSAAITVSTACTSSVIQSSTKTISVNVSSQSMNVESLNNKNAVKTDECKVSPSKEGETRITDEDDTASDELGMDVGSDRDSGCSSEYTNNSPTTDDNPGTTIIGPNYPEDTVSGDVDHDQESTDAGTEGSTKPRGKRRYYMYGSHKLVKPIKEIPLRFQILLAETSAAKARCEGQPIYMQHQQPAQQMYDVVYYQLPETACTQSQQQQPQAQLNANANCFVPGQPGAPQDGSQMVGAPYECYSLCYPTSNTVSTNLHGIPHNSVQPTPLFVPPLQQGPPPPSGAAPQPGSTPASSQNCQTIIMYPSQASQANVSHSAANIASQQQIRPVNMPPPPFPPPTTLPPPLTDPMSTNSTPCLSPTVNPVVVSLPTNPNQSKPHASSTYTKPQVVLSVPPPGHAPSHNHTNNKSSVPVTQISAPPPNPCMLSTNPTFLQPAPQHITLPSSSQHQPINAVQTTPSSLPQHVSPTPYPVSSTSPYMYVYPSPPTGQQGAPPQVMYMVSPAYPATPAGYQQPVLVPSSCPVPVQ
ncbi:hypothetical protein ElyMa_005704900 [Elysia marginata]|uniref:Uncharacterized protein n=1 Tax=Elysia marginata TaxID=1093978 RepID=A0AAV4FJ43_9GAST|nr:hypothetical protein ElyMa_005704900 [Elysia marginata]